jgi:hypothetical protein
VFAGLLAAVLVAGLGWTGWRTLGPSPRDYASMDDVDHRMLDRLSAEFDAAAAHPSELWTADYHYEDQPMALIRDDSGKHFGNTASYAVLVNMSDLVDTSRMAKITVPGAKHLDDVRVSKTYGLTDVGLWLPVEFTSAVIDGREVIQFMYDEHRVDGVEDNGYDFDRYLMHETFHGLQGEGMWGFSGAGGYVEDYPSSTEQRRLLRAELTALDAARAETDPTKLADLGKQIVQLRLERQARWPQLRKLDDIEAIEGTPTYFTNQYDRIRKQTDYADRSLVEILDVPDPNGYNDSWLTRDIAYDTGSAIGRMLDTLAPGWKVRITDGPDRQTPFAALRTAVGDPDRPSAEQLRQLAP